MKYYVIAPDSSGSKGDEALMRGVLNVLSGADITVLTTPNTYYTWKTELLDRCIEFEEKNVPFDCISEGIDGAGTLVVVGADVLDGTCGVIPAMSRLCAMNKMRKMGGRVYATCSFRSDVEQEIIDKIKEIGENVNWFFREETSVENFEHLTGLKGGFFPDFAYYCEKTQTAYTDHIRDVLKHKKEQGYDIVGLNFSQQSCNSFFDVRNEESRRSYITDTLEYIEACIEKPFFVLISHDIRNYDEHWSDTRFQELAETMIAKDQMMVLKDKTTYPEELVLLGELDYVISGRMHLAVAALRSGVVPIIYTGSGKNGMFSMAEKCRGMLQSRLHMPELVASDCEQLKEAVRIVRQNQCRLKEMLEEQNQQNFEREKELCTQLRKKLGLQEDGTGVSATTDEKIIALRDMVRDVFERHEKKEQDLQKQLNDKQKVIEELQKQLDEQQSHTETLQQDFEIVKKHNRDEEHDETIIRQINALGEWVESYEATFARLNRSLREIELKYQDLMKQNQKLQKQVISQKQEMDGVKGLLSIRIFQKLSNMKHHKCNS